MKINQRKELVIGVLGMPDNENTPSLIKYMLSNSIFIDFVVYWKPSTKDQVKRVLRKLKFQGIIPTVKRIFYAIFKSKLKKQNQPEKQNQFEEYYVSSHNSLECQAILKNKNVDILLLATDSIIYQKILEIPNVATLNAHPGWTPQFRGLGSLLFQLADGKLPAVSVHQVDEGIDTGPVILREYIDVDPIDGLDIIEKKVDLLQKELFLKVIKMFQKGNIKYIETFEEPSNMTRGMSWKERKVLDKKLKSGSLKLTPPN